MRTYSSSYSQNASLFLNTSRLLRSQNAETCSTWKYWQLKFQPSFMSSQQHLSQSILQRVHQVLTALNLESLATIHHRDPYIIIPVAKNSLLKQLGILDLKYLLFFQYQTNCHCIQINHFSLQEYFKKHTIMFFPKV